MIKLLSCLIPIKFLREYFRQFCYSIQVKFIAKRIGKNFRCGRFSTVNKNTCIGDNVFFNGLHISGKANVNIGNNVVFGFDSLIISDSHNYNGNRLPYEGIIDTDGVSLEDNVWVGARVTILPNSKIGEGVIIQAGSVVHGKIPPLSIIGGNPAKIFKYRNKEHYYKLKNKIEYT